jgi:hypothetical protein
MPTENNNNVEENYCQYYNSDNDNDNRAYNIKDNEQSGNVNWWSNELDSLGIKKNSNSSNNEDNNDKSGFPTSQQLEDLTDKIKQTLIRDYKACYDK